jgi:hypothetical protein
VSLLRIGKGVRRDEVREAVAGRMPDTIVYENVLEGEDIREAIAGVRAAGMPEGSMPLLAWLAAHSNMPEDVQRELFLDGNPDVLVGLAMNRSLPADLRQALMEHADEDVRHHANHVFFKVKRH